MGMYLNSSSVYGLFREESESAYFVDKSDILKELVPLVDERRTGAENTAERAAVRKTETLAGKSEIRKDGAGNALDGEAWAGKPEDLGLRLGSKYIAITRPRRFGKTVMANLIASYFGKGIDSSAVFDRLRVSKYSWYRRHLNRHNVIHIMFNQVPQSCGTYEQYITRLERRLLQDLRKAYPDAGMEDDDALWDALTGIYEYCGQERFIFVLDEWDYPYHQSYMTESDKAAYTRFLSNLLKDRAYVELAYMTGILPISKYSSGSELNMFFEYSMATMTKYSEYFGFTDQEVDDLYQRYLRIEENPKVTREGLETWYDGYQTAAGIKLYNPRSVVGALSDNQLASYWTSSGPYDEIFYYIGADVDAVKDDVALMVADNPVPARVQEYAATSMELKTKDEIFSAMVVYGFLNYSQGYVSIPNKELMDKFAEVVQREPSMGNVYKLTKESGRMLAATKAGDTKTMEELMEYAHHTHSPMQVYSNEAELASIIRWVYLKALDSYRIEREDKAGLGYVDFIFYPFNKADDAIIIELKVNHTADDAIRQIKERQYALRFEGKFGETPEYTGRILAVGIAYDKDDEKKRHECKVEVLRERCL